jgi:hypothetical protein
MRSRYAMAVVIAAVGICAATTSEARANSVTPICTTDQTGQQQCAGGWFTTPLVLSWNWSPIAGASPNPACTLKQQFDGDTLTTVTCDVNWAVPPEITYRYTVRVELSSPTANASPSRRPDSNGWYNHPLTASMSGSAFSGIGSCSAPTYAGPDSATAQITGTCVDNAGKTATATLTFRYDSTPPALHAVADPGDRTVRLTALVHDVAPLARIKIVRRPGARHAKAVTLNLGRHRSFDDTRVRNGSRYRYTFIARDVAGNVSERTVAVVPGPRLLAPARGAVVPAPPLLRWTPVRHASYYNVQLFRGRKILSRWPARARIQLTSGWTFARRHVRLRAGRYRWYVWPGFGPRSAARYGHLIGSATFVVGG